MNLKRSASLLVGVCLGLISFRFLWSALPENRYLLRAISEGNFEKVTLVYGQAPDSIDEVDVDGNGPLHIACQSSDMQEEPVIIWYLLDNFADARLRNNIQETAIHDVIYIANVDQRMGYINYLIKHGAPINARDKYHNTILDKCVIEHNLGACQEIMAWFGPLITKDTLENAKKLAGAQAGLGFGFTDIFEALNKKSTTIYDAKGYQEKCGMTALMYAVIGDDKKRVIDLLGNGAAINAQSQDRWGYSALELAIMQQNVPLVELLIQKGANRAQKNKLNQYPLMRILTIRNKSQLMKMGQLLMDKKLNINDVDVTGQTILHRAIRMNNEELVKALVGYYGTSINTRVKDSQGLSIVDIAAGRKGIMDIIKPIMSI